jgi:hypothetical protein
MAASVVLRRKAVLYGARRAAGLEGTVMDPGGYASRTSLAPHTSVKLLTPPPVVRPLGHGYRPVVHPSAGAR